MAFNLDQFLPYRLSVAAAQISRRFAARYAAEAGLTVPEWRVLAHLYHSGAVSVRDINVRVNLDKSMVSRAASRLQEAGWVRKSENDTDRRLVVLELTAEGRALMTRLTRVAEDFQAELLKELGSDAEGIDRALTKIIAKGGAD
ncbi:MULTISPECIES: MarR family winged helix-turn-helix transcriptional regulator [unclassified Paracoccus (in: a-proteobacteria)]|uniref:MarR family winged helix-turn-helix transcriptional regulator n=1 Tax=unclassified Paracoccus (in: a-proteobacteria) TaxID=2688777 RepID=UPI000225F7D3|nr:MULTISPECIES: MarR family winged helix-turn-helix transcriptional regulator [unclassified Paracoccus (in: a-proteobacteria)]SMG33834.1 DNA-binding transcriptional regulator, MarR family [Paracoccus sp. J56]